MPTSRLIARVYCEADRIPALRAQLLSLRNGALAPKRYSDSESRKDALAIKEPDFAAFLEANQGGYFLFSDACMYEFVFYEGEFAAIQCYFDQADPADADVVTILTLGDGLAAYAYACDEQEERHRNWIQVKTWSLFGDSMEAYVGRDLARYVPGLYWRTLISSRIIERHGLDMSVIPRQFVDHSVSGSYVLLRCYEEPNRWRSHADCLDALCSELGGVFSITHVRRQLRWAWSDKRFIKTVSQWR